MTCESRIEAVARAICNSHDIDPDMAIGINGSMPKWAIEDATAAISALEKLGAYVPEGWEAVPSEPTIEMQLAAFEASPAKQGQRDTINEGLVRIYKAFLAAKPKPAQGKE